MTRRTAGSPAGCQRARRPRWRNATSSIRTTWRSPTGRRRARRDRPGAAACSAANYLIAHDCGRSSTIVDGRLHGAAQVSAARSTEIVYGPDGVAAHHDVHGLPAPDGGESRRSRPCTSPRPPTIAGGFRGHGRGRRHRQEPRRSPRDRARLDDLDIDIRQIGAVDSVCCSRLFNLSNT
ncbi:hypothetical protein HBB16_19620 [Pseudonocardia sp. MCCB 268]|nr:hypothetical protein [Pseudonocardia cytotoxica]